MLRPLPRIHAVVCVCLALLASAPAQVDLRRPSVVIPRLEAAPQLEDFLEMVPASGPARKMLRVEGFLQREPSDGQPVSQRTEAYLGYDDKNLYAVFVCFDDQPEKIRARMVRRENFFGDDAVEIILDTFHDQRRAYAFIVNPYGVQWDAIWTEGSGFDQSFDTVWRSRGRLTGRGYVAWIAIPFRSLRFSSAGEQTWGLLLNRFIPRTNEDTFWPQYSTRVEGRLNQTARLEGLRQISPGRNIQLIPYGVFRSFRALDASGRCVEGVCQTAPVLPRFARDSADADAGLDAKFVLRDKLVLDLTFNPDFSQVESDEPQVTVNQRFEVFFPEKRPFFLENAGFFQTPINLLFTRRIADPQFGARLTGKVGPYALGILAADDQSPGRSVPPGHPLADERAYFGVLRVSRDLFRQSSIGVIFTDREFEGSFNRVGGLDARLKLGNWVATGQSVASSTKFLDGSRLAGPYHRAQLTHGGRHFIYDANFVDISPGFRTRPGFVPRTDYRRATQVAGWNFRPEGRYLTYWGPRLFLARGWDKQGTRLDRTVNPFLFLQFRGQTSANLYIYSARERLRPKDGFGLTADQDFNLGGGGFTFNSRQLEYVELEVSFDSGRAINFVPAAGKLPHLADEQIAEVEFTLRPHTQLRVDNTYILDRVRQRETGLNIFNNHILRSKWNWQFNRELSLRFIFQYNTLLTNPQNTSRETTKSFNTDFLVTYLVNPGTAVYVGYNSNLQNLAPGLCGDLPSSCNPGNPLLRRTPSGFINDSKQFFVKVSYLLRF